MNRIGVTGRLLLFILLFNTLNCWETKSPKDMLLSKSSLYIYYLLVVLPAITPDAACTTRLVEQSKLQLSTPIQANTSQIYVIYPEKKPIKVRITLLENNCQVYRSYYYCSQNKRKYGSLTEDIQGISCNDGTITSDLPIEGNTGMYEECDLSYDGDIYKVVTSFVPKRECKYEIRYN